MTWIDSIEVAAKTGSEDEAVTVDRLFLGMAGREFRMDEQHVFGNNDTAHVVFGPTGNTDSAKWNDPRRPRLAMTDLDVFPSYVRLEGDDGWLVESFVVTVESRFGERRKFANPNVEGEGLWLDELSGKYLYLKDVKGE
ncbi:hypothetical protein FHR84_004183 [Actinopolyspora biskrensis]|uniref:Uncharacterized protein n=1 Tax=Actinopolyspora biskrensis TaxID=1470178 RepID=A0A852Z646_9ACTN|nr:hypothetical protein [Actinopolyspora biskrensis]NYH80815.1 hypothetical protein [Actinopolyspora biskrensis]